ENDKIPVAKRYGMAILAYSPLAQGVLTGKYVDFNTKKWTTPSDSRAAISSGLQGYFNDRNLKILLELNEIAKSKGATLSQVSLAWLISMQERFGVNIIPIIGVSRMEHLEDNLGALNVKLSQDDLKRIDEVLKTQ
ncbi:aldo/keto reductase, partial [Caldivirga sp.]|uniref:aldo/keto reductase n=1 Tax=Caldivirga sp. TaxID=2080243 RepID=UPI003D14025F